MIDLTKIATPFGLLDAETQAALKAHGGPIEICGRAGWVTLAHEPQWNNEHTYRVKPAPLTPITAPWDHLADWVQWIARDEDGGIFAHEIKPYIHQHSDWYSGGSISELNAIKLDPGTCDWRDSLQQRPQVLA